MARPRNFDRDTALQKAMHLFWTKGYEGTSMSDLTEVMGISRSSLYETFGDKQKLFLEALNHYSEQIDRKKAASFANAVSMKQGMKNFLFGTVDFLLKQDLPGGCFYTNTATALGTLDESIQLAIQSGLSKNETFFYTILERGKQNGEIDSEQDIQALSRFFVGLVRGMTVVARITKDRKVLEDIVQVGLKVLD
jgi:TetR/AcrR family transcriptional repressor of nem operon